MDKHRCPENIPNLGVPRTNSEIWDLLPRGYQVADGATQRIQVMQAHALAALLSIINSIGNGDGGLTEAHLETLTDTTRLIMMAFSSTCQVRKELIRNSLGQPLAKFCTWDHPVGTDLIFPELSKKLKDRDDTQFKLRRRNRSR